MICIHCDNPKTNVTNSRPHKKRPTVWRRRSCDQCGTVFSTQEVIDVTDQLMVTRPDNSIQRFSLPTIMLSIAAALAHRANQADDAFWLAQTIAEELYQLQPDPLTPEIIASIAYDVLDRYDASAALQYGARHGIVATPTRRRNVRRRSS